MKIPNDLSQIPRGQAKSILNDLATSRDWVVLDTETTGTGRNDEIVEIGIIDAEGNELLHSLVQPTRDVPSAATEVHGIGPADLEDAPTIPQIAADIRDTLLDQRVLIFNSDFDEKMIRQSFYAQNVDPPIIDSVCVMKLCAAVFGKWNEKYNNWKWISQEKASIHRNIDIPQTHRALDDAQICRQIVLSFA